MCGGGVPLALPATMNVIEVQAGGGGWEFCTILIWRKGNLKARIAKGGGG